MRKLPVPLTNAQVAAINAAGGPTFRPLKGGRFRLNQISGVRALTPADVKSVRARCVPEQRRELIEMKGLLVTSRVVVDQPRIKVAWANPRSGQVHCPGCYWRCGHQDPDTKVCCPNCRLTFAVIAVSATSP